MISEAKAQVALETMKLDLKEEHAKREPRQKKIIELTAQISVLSWVLSEDESSNTGTTQTVRKRT